MNLTEQREEELISALFKKNIEYLADQGCDTLEAMAVMGDYARTVDRFATDLFDCLIEPIDEAVLEEAMRITGGAQ